MKRFNLNQMYQNESSLQKYIRLTVGEGASIGTLIWHELLLGFCLYIPGAAGLMIRNILYHLAFPKFSRKSYIGNQVTLRCPRQILLELGVIVDDDVQLIATSRIPIAISIGEKSFLRSRVMLNAGTPEGYIKIGAHCSIGQSTILYGNGGLIIGDNVMIAGQCFIVASSHVHEPGPTPFNQQGYTAKGITIGDNVWIGAGAKILDGVNIGDGAIIGSNAVVNQSVPSGATFAGIPARAVNKPEDM